MKLEEIKDIPRLQIKKVKVTDPEYLKQLVFPKDFVAPIGAYKEPSVEEEEPEQEEEEEVAEKKKKRKKKKKDSLVDSEKFDEQLRTGEISFYHYLPKISETVEGYGMKFISVDVTYKGGGLYHIVVETGFKLPMSKDNRVLVNNTDFPVHKEEIFLAHKEDEEEIDEVDENGEKKKIMVKRYRRVPKKTFEDLLSQLIELKIQPEIATMLLNYKKFFKEVFLQAATFHSKIQGYTNWDKAKSFFKYTNTVYNGTKEMEEVYDFHYAVGALDEISHIKIKKQIAAVQKHAKELIHLLNYKNYSHLFALTLDKHPNDTDILNKYNETKHLVIDMIDDKCWFNTYTGEFFHNAQSFYWEYIPTKQFYSKEIKEMQQQVTALEQILETFVDRKGEIPKDGILYVKMHSETKMEELIKTYNKKFQELKHHYEGQTFEEWERFTYLFEEKPMELGENEED
ncbi:hypothetical protein [Bacillus anthracis]|uniref:Uncharacterized protein n=1 Tax=Bacillus anthracis TaxID=1392 RepID=A0A0J1HK03_BACAN|nr:hypothetical protein [Bacillus anthracis]KLV14088.1 hypothetical protein ABW01_28925 [Bacillus anthracis]